MITKKIRAKGKVIIKESARGDNVYYIQSSFKGETRIFLMKDAATVVKNLRISPSFLPYVYGTIICYTKQDSGIQNKKFRIKGIDKHYKNRNSYGPSTKY